MDLTKQQLDNFITAGKVLDTYGLKGQLKVDIYLENLKLLRTIEDFFVGDSLIEVKIKFLKNSKKSIWIAAFGETNSKEQAERLKGQFIFLEKKYLPALIGDEFYYEDLKGLQVKIDSSKHKGFVIDVCNFGSGDVLEVSLDDRESTIYIPFNRDNVSRIDLDSRMILLSPIKGILS